MGSDEVRELISALNSGALSLDEVVARFKRRTWQRSKGPAAEGYAQMTAAAQEDPGANVPGSIDDVVAAYDRAEITHEQYRALAHAVADSINAEAARSSEADGQAD